MIEIEKGKLNTLLKYFFSTFFCDDLEEAFESDEVSVVTLFKGMDFFFELVKEQNIVFPYKTIEEYIVNTYEQGDVLYENLLARYNIEYEDYHDKDKTLDQIFGDTDFI